MAELKRLSRKVLPGQPWVAFVLVTIAIAAGASLLVLPPVMVMGAMGLLAITGVVIRWPLVGASCILLIGYIRPGETSSELSAMHVQRIVYLIVIAAITLDLAVHRRPLVRHPITWIVLAMLGAIVVGIPGAYWKEGALDAAEGFARVVVTYLILINLVDTEKAFVQLVYVLVIAIVIVCARTLVGYEGGRAFGPSSEFGNPNELSALVTSVLPFAFFLGIRYHAGSRLGRSVLLVSCVPMLVVVVLTNSRAGAIGLLVALAVISLKARRRGLALALSAGLLLITWAAMGPERKARILSISERGQDASFMNRVYAWRAARQMFLEHPFFGVGAGNFPAVYMREFVPTGRTRGYWLQVHNTYYQVLSELGLAGAICFVLLLLGCYRSLRRSRRAWAHLPGNPIGPITDAAEVALVVYLTASWAGHYLYRPYFYLMAAFAVIADHLTERRFAAASRRLEHIKPPRPETELTHPSSGEPGFLAVPPASISGTRGAYWEEQH